MNILYQKWLSWRILSLQSRLVHIEEKRLRLLKKKYKSTGEDNAELPHISARLRVLECCEESFVTTEEKINRTYHKIKHSTVAVFTSNILSFFRKYRALTGLFAYSAVIFSAVQSVSLAVLSFTFLVITLPVIMLFYALFALPRRVRQNLYAKQIFSLNANIYCFEVAQTDCRDFQNGYFAIFIKALSKNAVCLLSTGRLKENFWGIKKVDENVFVCSEGFLRYYAKKFSNGRFKANIKI